MRFKGTVPIIASASGGQIAAIQFNPRFNAHERTITACTLLPTTGVWTWSAYGNIPQYASLIANIAYYRVVSMGVKLSNHGRLLDRGMTLWINNREVDANSDSYAELQESVGTRQFDSVKMDEDEVVWIPYSLTSSVIDVLGAVNVFGPAWKSPYLGAEIEDNNITLLMFTDVVADSSDTLDYEFIMQYEFVPLPVSQDLFASEVVVSSDDKVAAAFVNKVQANTAASTGSVVSKTIRTVGGILGGTALRLAPSVIQKPLSNLMEWGLGKIASLFGSTLKRDDRDRAHYLAIALDYPQFSPFWCQPEVELKTFDDYRRWLKVKVDDYQEQLHHTETIESHHQNKVRRLAEEMRARMNELKCEFEIV